MHSMKSSYFNKSKEKEESPQQHEDSTIRTQKHTHIILSMNFLHSLLLYDKQ